MAERSGAVSQSGNKRRYSLVLPAGLFDEVERLAESKGMPVVDVFRQFTKLGLLVAQTEETPDTYFCIRSGNEERKVILL